MVMLALVELRPVMVALVMVALVAAKVVTPVRVGMVALVAFKWVMAALVPRRVDDAVVPMVVPVMVVMLALAPVMVVKTCVLTVGR